MKTEEQIYKKAIEWIHNNTVNDEGIIVSSAKRVIYPEVTGYYIPSLLNVGEEDLAKSFAKKLCSIQSKDGYWLDSDNRVPFIFDSGQILKGLVAIHHLMPEVDEHIIKGIEWIFSTMNTEGRLVQSDATVWGTDDYHCNDLIHIYTISPILEIAKELGRLDYIEKANQVLDFYINKYHDRIVNYTLFSHFYAYVIEGLIDCGRETIAQEAMHNFEKYRKSNGGVCAYRDVTWECTTAMFQFAIIWFKLGEYEKAKLTYRHTCELQQDNGGWYGCHYTLGEYVKNKWKQYTKSAHGLYGYKTELSWVVKFFLDAYCLNNGIANSLSDSK